MPPKSKKKESAEAETSDPAPRATRSSARGKVPAAAPPAKPSASGTRKASSSTKSTSNAPNGIATSHTSTQPSKDMDDEGQSSMKAAGKGKRKKAPEENDASRKVKQRTSTSSDLASATTNSRPAKQQSYDAETLKATKAKNRVDDAPPGGSSKQAMPSASKPSAPKPAPESPRLKAQPYARKHAVALFEKYADADDSDVIGPEGLEKLCEEADIPMDGAMPLLLAWQLNAKEMGKFTRKEWMDGMEELKIDNTPVLVKALSDLQELVITRSTSSKSASRGKATNDLYNKQRYQSYAADVKAAFGKLYSYCFLLAKPEQARNIDMETAMAFWSVLLVPQFAIMSEIIHFITEKGTYKGVNKDLWSMMYEFCQAVKPSLEGYESDGAWPTLLDDFVSWKKSTTGDAMQL